MKIIKNGKEQEKNSVINDTIVSMSEAIKSLHEAYQELFLRVDIATNFLSIPREKFMEVLQEVKDKNFDESFLGSIPKDKQYKVLEEGEDVANGDTLVCLLFDKQNNMIVSRILVNVGEKFFNEDIAPDFKIKEKKELSTGYIIPLYGVRFL